MSKIQRPDVCGIPVPGKRGRIITVIHAADCEGPHPVLINFHGIPGCEKNGDVVHAVNGMGLDVVTLHYSGCWGSDGEYRLAHNLEDADTVLDFILNDTDFDFDKNNIFALGHSMGGFVCVNFAAQRPEIKAAAVMMPCDIGSYESFKETAPEAADVIDLVLHESCSILNGVKYEDFISEIHENGGKWKFVNHAEALSKKPFMVITGSRDAVTPRYANSEALIQAIRKCQEDAGVNASGENDAEDQQGANGEKCRAGIPLLKTVEFDTEHFFLNSRPQVIETVCSFIKENLG